MKTPSIKSPRALHLLGMALAFSFLCSAGAHAAPPLVPGTPMAVPHSHGGFDFLEVDQQSSRLLAPHTRNGTFDVFQLPGGTLVKQCPAGATQDAAVDSLRGKYYVSGSAKPRLITFDQKTLAITGETPLPGPADVFTYDPKNSTAYIGHDDAAEVWAVDVAAQKIAATISIPEGPEGFVCDAQNDHVFMNAKTESELIEISTTSNKVVAKWPEAPAQMPHGLAMDTASGTLFSAGANGMLVEINTKDGKVIGSAKIAPRVDQIAYDPELKRVYCASGTGVMSTVQVSDSGLQSLGDVPTHKGAHSVAVDLKTHDVWTAWGDTQSSSILCLSQPK